MNEVRVSAVVLRDASGRVLLVRKRGTHMFMNPCGKPESGETAAHCAAREVAEELGLHLDPDRLTPLGQLRAPAANEPDTIVVADVFSWPEAVEGSPQPSAEIDAARWAEPTRPEDDWAPLFAQQIVPLLG